MTKMKNAIDYLGAIEVAPGRYAYRDDATRRYYVVDADDLGGLYDYDDDGQLLPIDAPRSTHAQYSVWCADTQATEMPSWWAPEQPPKAK